MSNYLKPIVFNKYEEMGAYHWTQCSRRAPNYNPPLEARYQVVVNSLTRVRDLLDVGCGDGYLLSRISNLCGRAIGIDSESGGIACAVEKLQSFRNCVVLQASAYEIPFADSSFDTVVLTDVFEHLEDPAECLSEITRVLRPAGQLILTTPKWRPDRMWDRLHVKEYTPKEVFDCLSEKFVDVNLSFFWPMSWYKPYDTRIGFKALRFMLRHLPNPYANQGNDEAKYGQILAVCSRPQVRTR